MRVLHLLKTAHGAAWAWRQVRELVASGHDIHVGLPDGPMAMRYRDVGATVHRVEADLPLRRPTRVRAVLEGLRRVVAEVGPELIHTHHVGSAVASRLALGRRHSIPRVFEVPGPLHLEHPFFRRAEVASAGAADWWIPTCDYTGRLYREVGVPEARLRRVYAGTDLDVFTPAPPGKLRAELGLAEDVALVGMVAYFYAPKRMLGQTRGLKGHEDLIDAVALLRAEGRKVEVVFAGGAWGHADAYERRVHAYAARRLGPHARFLGVRHDVPSVYADVDVAACPSHSENIGAAGESSLLGVPTVATTVGGFPELIRPGETGWLVPPKAPAALAEALAEALDDPGERRRRAEAAQRLARTLFDVRETARDVAAFYTDILHATRVV